MKRVLVLLSAVCAIAGGCRRDPHMDAYLNVLYSQQRALEDRLNDLSYEHAAAVDELAAAEEKNRQLLRELGRDDSVTPSRRPRSTPPSDETEPDETPELTPPMIEQGEPFTPTGRQARGVRAAPASTSAARGPVLNGNGPGLNGNRRQPNPRSDGQGRGASPSPPSDTRVTHIVLNPYLTQGHDFDGQPGDDGIALAVEPRNAADEYVPAAGKLSVVVIDPAVEDDSGRIARWDFETDEIARRLERESEQGIVLRLPWPKAPPTRAELKVFVRYVSADEQKLEANRPLYLNLPGQFSHRWTPKSSRPAQDLEPEQLEALAAPTSPDSDLRIADARSVEPEALPTPASPTPAAPEASAPGAAAAGESVDGPPGTGFRPAGPPSTSDRPSPAPPSPPQWRPYR